MSNIQESSKLESAQNVSLHIGIIQEKVCFKCGKTKKSTEFYKHPRMADGRLHKCKECTKKDVSRNYRENIGYYKKYELGRLWLPCRIRARDEYTKTESGIINLSKAKKKWKKLNPEKRKAYEILNNAVRDGRVEKKPCAVCNSTYRIHGHHENYDKPLDVIWLCPSCHSMLHFRKRHNSGEEK